MGRPRAPPTITVSSDPCSRILRADLRAGSDSGAVLVLGADVGVDADADADVLTADERVGAPVLPDLPR
ncbi:MAG: hypothetical protein H0T76_25595 [Nannocystis sp.]|nr:hypothetical protein [Nannocystis sp.]MBA3549868.1 hypothetical protein [Nannocystis sp.]